MKSVGTRIVAIRFERDAERSAAERVLECLGCTTGPDPRCRWHEPGLLTVKLSRPLEARAIERLREFPGVERVVGISGDRGLVSRVNGEPPSAVDLGHGVRIGAGEPVVVAGPCSVESEAQVCEIAEMVKEAGARALRGGVFKPRSSPYSFGGLGDAGLEHLVRARERTGLPIVTEALDCMEVGRVARYADAIQIGSRNMHNFNLLFKAGNHPLGTPVVLKRGFGATVDEFILAAEYVLLGRLFAGIDEPRLVLCERGIRTFETSLRFTLDVGAIPVLKDRTHLPVIADPSHPSGHSEYVPPLARAAVAAGADGLLVEVHTDPKRSWCDASQALDPESFRRLMVDLNGYAELASRRAVAREEAQARQVAVS